MIESHAAALAATMADEADLANIEHRFRQLDTVITEHALGVQEDFDFHLAVARASKNQFFTSAIGSIQSQIVFSMNLMRNLSLVKTLERRKLVQTEHEAIVQALRRRDAAGAAAAMRAHLENARDRMFGKQQPASLQWSSGRLPRQAHGIHAPNAGTCHRDEQKDKAEQRGSLTLVEHGR